MQRQLRVWFMLAPGAEALDVTGPWQVLSHANDVVGREAYALQLVSPDGGDVQTRHGLVLGGTRSLRSARSADGVPDILVGAGGAPYTPLPEPEGRLVRWIERHHPHIGQCVSICTGAFLLGEAGLLDDRRVTTHWRFVDELRRRFPRASVVDDGIYERSGNVWTSAGIASGIDLALALVEVHHGQATAVSVAKNLVLFLRRSGNQAQFSEALRQQSREPEELRGIIAFIHEHMHEALPLARLARALGMSTRTLSRACRQQMGASPGAFVRHVRLERARQLLEHGALPLKSVARQCGLGDVSTLHRHFTRAFKLSPAQYRNRFG
jgi:transcriptional regulator GlxA family with amidase domain